MIRVMLSSVIVDGLDMAFDCHTPILGFRVVDDIPMGGPRGIRIQLLRTAQ